MMYTIKIGDAVYLTEKRIENGDVLFLQNGFPLPEENLYLLSGESLQRQPYAAVIETFSLLKKRGAAFVLCMVLPLRIRDFVRKSAEQGGIADDVYLLEDEGEIEDLLYKERICVPMGMDNSLFLARKGILIDANLSSLMENCFRGSADEDK